MTETFEENLEEKLFKAGYFGMEFSKLNLKEQDFVLTNNHFEVIDETTYEELTKNMDKIVHKNTENLQGKCFARLNSPFWIEKACGGISFQKQECYKVINYFVTNQKEKIKMYDLSKKLDISTKDTSYAVGLFKKHDVLETDNDGLLFYAFKKCEVEKNDIVFDYESKNKPLPQMIINYGIVDLLKEDIYESKSGVTTDYIYRKYGFPKRHALSVLEHVVKLNKEDFLIMDMYQGSSNIKVAFSKENKKAFDQIKIEKVEGKKNDFKLEYVSREDKLNLFKKLYEKCDTPILFNEVFLDQIKTQLNMKDRFDKKSLLTIAREAGFKDIKVLGQKTKRILFTEKYNEEDIVQMFDDRNEAHKNRYSALEKLILYKPEYVLYDNQYEEGLFERAIELYIELRKNKKHTIFDGKRILEIPLFIFLRMVKIDEPHFLPNILNDIANNNYDERLIPEPEVKKKKKDVPSKFKMLKESLPANFNSFQNAKCNEYSWDTLFYLEDLCYCKIKDICCTKTASKNRSFCRGLNPLYYKNLFEELKRIDYFEFEVKDGYIEYKRAGSYFRGWYRRRIPPYKAFYEERYTFYKYLNNCKISEIPEKTKSFLEEIKVYYPDNWENMTDWINRFLNQLLSKKDMESENFSSSDWTESEETELGDEMHYILIVCKIALLKQNCKIKDINELSEKQIAVDQIEDAFEILMKRKIFQNNKSSTLKKYKLSQKYTKFTKDLEIKEVNKENVVYEWIKLIKKHTVEILGTESSDISNILDKLRFVEKWELLKMFKEFKDNFSEKTFGGVSIYSNINN
ncbi:hypothetical protein EHP00_1047 [Ecytonucleospora hepatopenaei]|uniref:Uncharacterized protein n=1 Tax=Ecytonucleospora hepatopenaei TaxID=646526 RepID=A0A1W0E5J3_9MICR|nr:hypothetical protein EHP00_1047 [Ecytonucleospora hepatopenaei]